MIEDPLRCSKANSRATCAVSAMISPDPAARFSCEKPIGAPSSWVVSQAISSARRTYASCHRSSTVSRSATSSADHPSNARRAACTARSASSSEAKRICALGSSVAGSCSVKVSSPLGRPHSSSAGGWPVRRIGPIGPSKFHPRRS